MITAYHATQNYYFVSSCETLLTNKKMLFLETVKEHLAELITFTTTRVNYFHPMLFAVLMQNRCEDLFLLKINFSELYQMICLLPFQANLLKITINVFLRRAHT